MAGLGIENHGCNSQRLQCLPASSEILITAQATQQGMPSWLRPETPSNFLRVSLLGSPWRPARIWLSTVSSHEGPSPFLMVTRTSLTTYHTWPFKGRWGGWVADPCPQTHGLTGGTGQDTSPVCIISSVSLKSLGPNQTACPWVVRSVQGGKAGLSTVWLSSFSKPLHLGAAKYDAKGQDGLPKGITNLPLFVNIGTPK